MTTTNAPGNLAGEEQSRSSTPPAVCADKQPCRASARAVAQLKSLADAAQRTHDIEALLGVEGSAARVYFEQFAGMLKVEDQADRPVFDFEGRNRRPLRDPVNALLSLAYSLLARDLTIVCHAVGFDPFMGFFHQPRFGRPALALGLMEPNYRAR